MSFHLGLDLSQPPLSFRKQAKAFDVPKEQKDLKELVFCFS